MARSRRCGWRRAQPERGKSATRAVLCAFVAAAPTRRGVRREIVRLRSHPARAVHSAAACGASSQTARCTTSTHGAGIVEDMGGTYLSPASVCDRRYCPPEPRARRLRTDRVCRQPRMREIGLAHGAWRRPVGDRQVVVVWGSIQSAWGWWIGTAASAFLISHDRRGDGGDRPARSVAYGLVWLPCSRSHWRRPTFPHVAPLASIRWSCSDTSNGSWCGSAGLSPCR